jgi:t-SNARE complex subunit (syntaxin)
LLPVFHFACVLWNVSCPVALVRNDKAEGPRGAGGEVKGSMQEFFRVVEIVKKNIVAIRDAAKQIAEINQELVFATTEEKEETASQGLAQLIQTGNKNAKTAQSLLKDLNKEVKDLEDEKASASELRIRKNLVQTLTKKYIDVLKEYQNVQNKSKEVKKKRAVKRVQQMKPDATPEEIEAVVQSGNAGAIMKQSILQVGQPATPLDVSFINAACCSGRCCRCHPERLRKCDQQVPGCVAS